MKSCTIERRSNDPRINSEEAMNAHSKILADILAPISLGELIDKITILEIKKVNMNGIKLINVNRELALLKDVLKDKNLELDVNLVKHLKKVNDRLWEIEDKIRIKENQQQFDKEFIELARSVYKQNDIRASIKRQINQKYNSGLIEEKSYKK